MLHLVDALMVLLVLLNLVMVGSSRLGACVRAVATQGVVLGLLPVLLFREHALTVRIVLVSALGVSLRGVIFPWLLMRALRLAGVHREVEPFVGYPVSILCGILAVAAGFWMTGRMHLPDSVSHTLMAPVSLSTILVGLFIIVSRKLALNQVLGYLVLENGIFVLGIALVEEVHLLVELGVLLDAFVAVFVMSIATYRISREFDHMEVHQLDSLKG